MSGVLDESLCYLIGAIDAAVDHGKGWRSELIQTCREKGLNIKFLDPTNKVTGLQEEVGDEQVRITNLKESCQWDELSELMETIVHEDDRCVDLSDFIIFYLDPTIHTCGSYFELQAALLEKKPYFLIVPQGKRHTPSWLFGVCNHQWIFDSISSVVEHLVLLNNGQIPLNKRWVLFRQQIKNL